jgi:hypothetical protein
MQTPIVFLDIDGVLNSKRWFAQISRDRQEHAPKGEPEIWAGLIDPTCVACLNSLLEQTGASVVLCSSWRKTHAIDEITTILSTRGFRGQIIGATSANETMPRGQEIAAWITEHNGNNILYVVLDDERTEGLLPEALICPSEETGLTDVEVLQAVRVLTPQ